MIKQITGLFLLLFSIFFFSCEQESGPSMNEDYAGTWYMLDDGYIEKLIITDSSFEVLDKYPEDSDYVPWMKGLVNKESASSVSIAVNAIYYTGGMISELPQMAGQPEGWYDRGTLKDLGFSDADLDDDFESFKTGFSLSEDGSTLTIFDSEYSDTEPEFPDAGNGGLVNTWYSVGDGFVLRFKITDLTYLEEMMITDIPDSQYNHLREGTYEISSDTEIVMTGTRVWGYNSKQEFVDGVVGSGTADEATAQNWADENFGTHTYEYSLSADQFRLTLADLTYTLTEP